jgi:hypothetical protein
MDIPRKLERLIILVSNFYRIFDSACYSHLLFAALFFFVSACFVSLLISLDIFKNSAKFAVGGDNHHTELYFVIANIIRNSE